MGVLPPEIILLIIDSVVQSTTPVVFPPSHPVTRTLLSLTLVSKLTSPTAKRLLIKHCLHIGSKERFEKFILPRRDLISGKRKSDSSSTIFSPKGLFLCPYEWQLDEDPKIAKDINILLPAIKNTLTRLVIDIPLRSLYPEDDEHSVRSILRAAFSELTALEEFCSARDELFLESEATPRSEPEVWPLWPRLKRLALYNPDIASRGFLNGVKNCPNLTHLVLTRLDGVGNFPNDHFKHPGLKQLDRVVIVNSVNAPFCREDFLGDDGTFLGELSRAFDENFAAACDVRKPYGGPLLHYVTAPASFEDDTIDDNDIEVRQEWVRDRALDGSLWHLTGDSIYEEYVLPI